MFPDDPTLDTAEVGPEAAARALPAPGGIDLSRCTELHSLSPPPPWHVQLQHPQQNSVYSKAAMDSDELLIFFFICAFAIFVTFFWPSKDEKRRPAPLKKTLDAKKVVRKDVNRFNPGY